jgi:hypothetical protein
MSVDDECLKSKARTGGLPTFGSPSVSALVKNSQQFGQAALSTVRYFIDHRTAAAMRTQSASRRCECRPRHAAKCNRRAGSDDVELQTGEQAGRLSAAAANAGSFKAAPTYWRHAIR